MSVSVLIVDDEIDIQSSLSFALKDEGYEVFTASSPREALTILAETHIDIGLYDVWFPDGDGIELLKVSHDTYPDVSVVMMSGHGNIELALKSIRLGAYDFLEKPLELEKVLLVLKNAVQSRQLRDENARLLETILKKGQIVGRSPAILGMRSELERESKLSSLLVLNGEPGAGRELSARVLHQISSRRSKPFISVNATVPNAEEQRALLFGAEKGSVVGERSKALQHRIVGALESSGEGTLLVENLPAWQASVLDELAVALREGHFVRLGGHQKIKFEARALFSTSVGAKIASGKFQDHLAAAHQVRIPSLKERREDTVELARHFVLEFGSAHGLNREVEFSEDLKGWLLSYDWPGNVRELKNLAERMVIAAPGKSKFGIDDLPEEFQALRISAESDYSTVMHPEMFKKHSQGSLREWRSAFEKALLQARLDAFDHNVTKTAESLGVERAHLHRKLKNYGLNSAKEDA
ncbi:MAG TPA: sigma-54 dependent transcriptional regulator [Bdellovibrionota bacterium]|nr:sigma-54 dependent transcriptional regulator [Bdellovibrionota bacterium]